MEYLLLTSAKNPRVKQVYSLRERKERDKEGVTILEGYRELSRAHLLGIKLPTKINGSFILLGYERCKQKKQILKAFEEFK